MTDPKRRRLMQAGASLPLLGMLPALAQAPASKLPLLIAPRQALVIGNSTYRFGPLKNPANDARAIGEELKRSGFEVATGLDLPRKEMLEAIRAYAESLTRGKAVGIFYFAGHGVQLAWRNYLLPVDAELRRPEDIEARCVDVNAVIDGIARAANPMNVVILDACRENPFAGVKLEQRGLSQLDAPPGTLLAYATAPGNLASDGDGANGLYTEQLLKEMRVPDAKIEDIFKRVRLTVRRRSNGAQIPWESTSLEEDFWFIPPREMQKLAAEERERIRKAEEAERLRRERIEQAKQREEAERLRREAEEERARLEAASRRARELLARAYQEEVERRRKQEESDRAYEEELRFWERVSVATVPGPLEEYLRRYPSGRFSEIAQVQLDRILAAQGEKKVEVVAAPENPYSQGTATLKSEWKVGDTYTYNFMDLYSKVVSRTSSVRITEIRDTQVIYNNGQLVTDLLGNNLHVPDGRRFTPSQFIPTDYRVGKRWRTRFNVTHPQFGQFRNTFDLRIASRERVTVPAGTFDTYRIDAIGVSEGARMLRLEISLWMAPDRCRRAIARNELRRNQYQVIVAERQELAAFTQA